MKPITLLLTLCILTGCETAKEAKKDFRNFKKTIAWYRTPDLTIPDGTMLLTDGTLVEIENESKLK